MAAIIGHYEIPKKLQKFSLYNFSSFVTHTNGIIKSKVLKIWNLKKYALFDSTFCALEEQFFEFTNVAEKKKNFINHLVNYKIQEFVLLSD